MNAITTRALKTHHRIAAWLICAIALTVSVDAWAARVQPIQNVENAPIPNGLSMQKIKEAMVKAGAIRNWVVTEEGPGELLATLHLRSHVAKVAITYDTEGYSITYRDSTNLKYKAGKIHRNYNSWVQNLNGDIQLTLSLLQ